MLDTPCSEVVWRVLATHSIREFPLHFPSRASPCAITFQLDSTIGSSIRGTASKSKIQSYADPFLFIFKIPAVWELSLSMFRIYFFSGPFHLHGHSGNNIFTRTETITLSFTVAQQPIVGQSRLRASRSHPDTPHSGRPVSGISLPVNTTLATKRHSYSRAGFEPTIPASDRPQTYSWDPRGHLDGHWLPCYWYKPPGWLLNSIGKHLLFSAPFGVPLFSWTLLFLMRLLSLRAYI